MPTDNIFIRFEPGLVPVLKHGSHDQSSHGRKGRSLRGYEEATAAGRGQRTRGERSAIDDALRQEEENMNYLLGRTTKAPSWTGPSDPLFVPKTTLRDRVQSARRSIKAWKQKREKRSLERMSPAQIDRLIAANRERNNRERVRRGLAPTVYKSFDPVYEILQRIFADEVEPSIWVALIEDPRPLNELTGVLGDLVDDMLDAVVPDETIVKFAPGLRPVLKHLGGKHDQKAHGRGGGPTNGVSEAPGGGQFSAWGDRAGEISAAASTGPTRETLQKIINDDIEGMISDEEVMQEIALRYDYEIENDVQERMNRTIGIEDEDEEFATREKYYDEVLGDYYMANAYYTRREMVEERFNEDMDSYVSQFSEVYDTYHSGVNRDGEKISFYTQVETVDSSLGEGIDVKGTIYSDDGNWLGEFHRRFEGDGSGGITVTHELLRLEDEAQGTGFAKVFNRQAENYYISHGIDKVNVHAALDGGGYAWAQQGFDFDEKAIRASRNNISYRMEAYLQQPGIPRNLVSDIQGVRTRLETLDLSSPDFPTPKEIADLGRIPGVQTWPGKEIMRGSNWYGTKTLSPSGPRKSTTQKWKEDRAKAAEADLLRYEQLQLDFGESVAMPFGQGSTPNLRY